MQDNPKFYEYYQKNLNLTDEDFRSFITSLNTPLGFTFRILDINLIPIINTCPFFKKVNFLKNVYQCQKEEFKKSKIRKLIITYTNIGHIQRQEIVSMLPVLFLNLKPDHYVLDMCAAPGSKSSQIIEIVKKGLIVCNDFNRKRLDILKSHTNKFNSKCLLILNNDARNLPNIKLGDEDIKFDRVLCDVPCSGDGTIRKNLNALKNWKEENGMSLHKTQFEILKRGLELLKEDGILVYSTCSFNPVENECVVQRAVLQLNCEIIPDESLKEIKTRKGLKKWDLGIIENDKNKHLFSINEDIGLEKCMRVYPQDQDTGGFFIAVLKKEIGKEI
ncbi:tRNA (cytosine(34)-C(5))-methyltransferase [Gurleya vavrai]